MEETKSNQFVPYSAEGKENPNAFAKYNYLRKLCARSPKLHGKWAFKNFTEFLTSLREECGWDDAIYEQIGQPLRISLKYFGGLYEPGNIKLTRDSHDVTFELLQAEFAAKQRRAARTDSKEERQFHAYADSCDAKGVQVDTGEKVADIFEV